ncbi:MAG TPA: carboxymuconolactone decarboxylase family protein [Candidatus Lokiarchaeia archaeon]|nr:carboxymuconolactone decarboxylase family protein [Candidatus Lokiarchaeia archaeon]
MRRSFTFRSFIRTIANLLRRPRDILHTVIHNQISPDFSERIMLAVTAVNGCRYCTYVHTKLALEQGCTPQVIQAITNFEYARLKEDEVVALAFAQHYAESRDSPSKDALKQLWRYYGPTKARDILNSIQLITVGNLTGNALDAFKSRLRGIPPDHGSFLFEFIVYIIGMPVTYFMLN